MLLNLQIREGVDECVVLLGAGPRLVRQRHYYLLAATGVHVVLVSVGVLAVAAVAHLVVVVASGLALALPIEGDLPGSLARRLMGPTAVVVPAATHDKGVGVGHGASAHSVHFVLLLQRLHLLLLLVGTVNRLPNRPADGTPRIFAPVVVAEHIPRTDTVRNLALLILALGNVLPKPLHPAAVRRHRTIPVLVGALCSVAEEEEPLLLVPEDLLPVGRRPGCGCAYGGGGWVWVWV